MSVYSWFILIWIQTRSKQCIWLVCPPPALSAIYLSMNYETSFQQWELLHHRVRITAGSAQEEAEWASIRGLAERTHILVVLKEPPNSKTVVSRNKLTMDAVLQFLGEKTCVSSALAETQLSSNCFSRPHRVGVGVVVNTWVEYPFSYQNDWGNEHDYASN